MERHDLEHLFKPVRAVRSFDDIVVQIQAAIRDGALQAGDRLPSEREFVKLFGTSRSTVREALRLLEGCQRVTIRRGATGGVFVSEPDAKSVASALESLVRFRRAGVKELAEFRPEFEASNAQLAAERSSEDEANEIVLAAERYAELAGDLEAPWRELVDLDIAFHERVAATAKNEIRYAISLGINMSVREASLALEAVEETDRAEESAQLRGIASAIQKHDGKSAYECMLEHVKSNSIMEIRATELRK